MDSITLYTEEIDELSEAADELFAQAESFSFKKNSMAIIFVEEETDYEGLYAILSGKWKFPIMGCTAMAMFHGDRGYCDVGISVMLLTADDCEFSVGMTGELTKDNYNSEIASVYGRLKSALDGKEKLVITYGGMVTSEHNVGGDDLVNAISAQGENVPVYGGSAADNFNSKNIKVFCGDRVTGSGQVMALVAGNIHPRFVSINSIEKKGSYAYEVTRSDGNRVFRLGQDSFVGTLRRENMATDKPDVFVDYLLTPFIVSISKPNGDKVEAARSLSVLNMEDGSGSFLGAVPEGAVLNIGIVRREDVQKTVGKAMDEILSKMKETGQEYKTMLCTTCCARFLALGGNVSAETDSFKGFIPPSISLMGMYSNGEYCPARGNVTGEEYNMFHNFTFSVLAF